MVEDESYLRRILVDRGVAAVRIMAEQIETAIKSMPSNHHAFAEMPVPIVCWWLGHQIAELLLAERNAQPIADRVVIATQISSTFRFLKDSAELNSIEQPQLAEQALTAIDGFMDELTCRPAYWGFGSVDGTYGGLITAPAGMPT